MSKQRQGKRYMHFPLCFCILSQLYVYGKCIYLSNALQTAVCVWYGKCHITFYMETSLHELKKKNFLTKKTCKLCPSFIQQMQLYLDLVKQLIFWFRKMLEGYEIKKKCCILKRPTRFMLFLDMVKKIFRVLTVMYFNALLFIIKKPINNLVSRQRDIMRFNMTTACIRFYISII